MNNIDYTLLDTDEARTIFRTLVLQASGQPLSFADIATDEEINKMLSKLTVADLVAMPHDHDRAQFMHYLNQIIPI